MCRALYGRRVQQLLGGCAGTVRTTRGSSGGGRAPARGRRRPRPRDPPDPRSDRRRGSDPGGPYGPQGAGRRPCAARLGHHHCPGGGAVLPAMDRYRTLWQDVRGSTPVPRIGDAPAVLSEAGDINLDRMVRAFKLGLKDLLPIWEQAFQEETLAGLYPLGVAVFRRVRVSRVSSGFVVIFDVAVAYHEHRLPHDHLLRALTPLYLGRVAGVPARDGSSDRPPGFRRSSRASAGRSRSEKAGSRPDGGDSMRDAWSDILVTAFREVVERLSHVAPRLLAMLTLVIVGGMGRGRARASPHGPPPSGLRPRTPAASAGDSPAACARGGIRRRRRRLIGHLIFWTMSLRGDPHGDRGTRDAGHERTRRRSWSASCRTWSSPSWSGWSDGSWRISWPRPY